LYYIFIFTDAGKIDLICLGNLKAGSARDFGTPSSSGANGSDYEKMMFRIGLFVMPSLEGSSRA
jgi:hypothetical protein